MPLKFRKGEASRASASLGAGNAQIGSSRRRRVIVLAELALIGVLMGAVYGLAVHFIWIPSLSRWIFTNRGPAQTDALVVYSVILVVGLLVFSLRRWRDSEAKAASLGHAQEALRLQSAALTAAANAIIITDRDGTVVWANPAFTTMTGYALEEAVGRNPRDLVKSGRQEREVYQQLWETIAAGRVWHGELVNRRKDGSDYPEEQTITPVRGAGGEVTHYIAIKRDLSTRRRFEEALRVSERKFQSVFEQAAVGVLIAEGPRGRLVNVNRRLCEMLGYTAEELLALTSCDVTHPDDVAADIDEIEQINFGVIKDFSREKRYRRKDGSYFWAKAFVAPLDPSEAMPSVRIGVIVDIDERNRAQEALRLSEEHYRSLFDHMLNGFAYCKMIFVDGRADDFTYISVNPAFEKLTGLKEPTGKKASVVIPGIRETDRELLEIYGRVALTGVPQSFEYNVKALDMWFSISIYSPKREFFVAVFDVITERKKAEAELRLFRALIEQTKDGIMVVDPATGTILDVNQSAYQTLGYTRDEILKLTILDVAIELDRTIFDAVSATLRKTGKFTRENVHRRKDGTTFPVEVSLSLVVYEREYVVAVSRDITERRAAEDVLRREQALFLDLGNTIPDHIYFKDRQSRFVQINAAMARQFGLREAAEAIGKTDFDMHGSEHARQAFADEQRIMANGEPMIAVEEREEWPDGRVTWVSTTKVPLRDAQGRVTGLVGISRDITERRITDTKLREFNEIFSNSHEGVMIVNLANEVTLWNHGAEELFGWTSADALGRAPEELLGITDPGVVTTLRAAAEREGFWNGEFRAKTRNGREIVVECRLTLVRDAKGTPRARLNFLADITEKKNLEERFLQAQRLESLGMLAAGIAHDLNNVLAPIVFAAPMLRERISDSGDLKILDMLERSASRGAGLVKQILGFAHSNTAEFRPTQVKHLVRDVVSVLEQTLPKSIRIEHHIPSDLWVTLGNPTQIHQVLLNLCVNARDAMPRGGTLRVSAANRQLDAEQAAALPGARAGSWVVIEIADTGTGIPEDVLPHIWEPFFTTKGPDRGTGLGLSTVRGIVATHQGFITLETRPGLGSTFSAYFPATAETSAVGVRTPNSAAPNGNRELILVVDDDMTICRMVATMLTRHNYSILTAGNGVEAVDVFNAHWRDIALVITDIDMPHLGGAGLARILVAKRPDLRLLIISGLGQSKSAGADFDEASKLARGVLPKPFTQETLLKTVHEMLNSGPKT